MNVNVKKDLIVDLLDQYKDANLFSLTGRFSSDYTIGEYKLTEEEGEKILNKIWEHGKESCKLVFSRFSDDVKSGLPPFEELFSTIDVECQEFQKRVSNGELKEKESPFICDHFREDTNYSSPMELWHFYHRIGVYYDTYKMTVKKLMKNTKPRPLDTSFNNEEMKSLYKHIDKHEVTFTWHCTTCSSLSIVYYFRLNEESKKWLMQFESDLDITPLEDLAFYENDELLFSSCTHEGFNIHIRQKG